MCFLQKLHDVTRTLPSIPASKLPDIAPLYRNAEETIQIFKHGYSQQLSDNTYEKITDYQQQRTAEVSKKGNDRSKQKPSTQKGVTTAVVHRPSGEVHNDEATYVEIKTNGQESAAKNVTPTLEINADCYEITQSDGDGYLVAGDVKRVTASPTEPLDELRYMILPKHIQAPYTELKIPTEAPGLQTTKLSHSQGRTNSTNQSENRGDHHVPDNEETYAEITEEPLDELGCVMPSKHADAPYTPMVAQSKTTGTGRKPSLADKTRTSLGQAATDDSLVADGVKRVTSLMAGSHGESGYTVPKKHVEAPYTALRNQKDGSCPQVKGSLTSDYNGAPRVDDEYLVPDNEEAYTTIEEEPCDEMGYVVPGTHIDAPYTALIAQSKSTDTVQKFPPKTDEMQTSQADDDTYLVPDDVGYTTSIKVHRDESGYVDPRVMHIEAPYTPLKQGGKTVATHTKRHIVGGAKVEDKNGAQEHRQGYLVPDGRKGKGGKKTHNRLATSGYETTIPTISNNRGRYSKSSAKVLPSDTAYETIDFDAEGANVDRVQGPQYPQSSSAAVLMENQYDDTQAIDDPTRNAENGTAEYLEISN